MAEIRWQMADSGSWLRPPQTAIYRFGNMTDIVFLTRDRCLLCHEALPWVEARARRRGHALTVVDVDTDPGLRERFGERVPVVLRDGEVVLAGRFTKREVRRALR